VSDFLRACPIAKHFLDDVVPLLGIALHGSHNCGESIFPKYFKNDPEKLAPYLKHMQSLHLTPSYEVCMRPSPEFGIPAYEGKEEIMAQAYQATCGPKGYVGKYNQVDIQGHWDLGEGRVKVRYENNIEITIDKSV